MTIRKSHPNDLPDLVRIFQKELPLSFFNQFGPKFIELYVKAAMKVRSSFSLSAIIENKVIGFAIASTNPIQIFQNMILQSPITLIKILVVSIAGKPVRPKNILQALFANIKQKNSIKPELLSIAIDRGFQGKGVGKSLIKEVEKEFKKANTQTFKVGVWEELERANLFYLKTGASFYYSINLFGRKMNYYLYKVPRKGCPESNRASNSLVE